MTAPRQPIPPSPHGGVGLDFIDTYYPGAPRPWLDLSTGINPWPYPPGDVPQMAWCALPPPSLYRRCREAAARYFGADAGNIAVLPGSQAAISLLPRLFPPGIAAVLEPTYREHRTAWEFSGHAVRSVGTIDEARDADTLIVVNPNNPNGRIRTAEAVHRLAAERSEHGRWLVIDEAFVDAVPDLSTARGPLGATTIILRSFGKFFGLAGTRLGFVIAPGDIVHRLEATVGPWAVSGPALEIAARAYADIAWQKDTRARLDVAAGHLRALLGRHGLKVVGGTNLFTLAEHDRADALFETLCRHGLYVRRFDYNARWLRFGLPPDDAACGRLEDALAGWASEAGTPANGPIE